MKQYKVVTHLHSSYSYDGQLSLGELRTLFQKNGIQCALMSEHPESFDEKRIKMYIEECKTLSDRDFLFIPGFEIPYRNAHILCFGVYTPTSLLHGLTTIEHLQRAGAIPVLAHPHRNTFELYNGLENLLCGIEIWNGHYDGTFAPRWRSYRLWQEAYKHNPYLFASAGLDFHGVHHNAGPHLIISAPEMNEGAILTALRTGSFIMRGRILSCGSRPTFSGPRTLIICLMSAWSLCIVKLLTIGGRIFHALALPIPASLKNTIRRFI